MRGLLENVIYIGDRLRVGSAEFVVTQPRLPCVKLGIRLEREDIVNRFLHSEKSGFHLAVVKEGVVSAGNLIELLPQNDQNVTVAML